MTLHRLALVLGVGACASSPKPGPTPAPIVVVDQATLNPAAQAKADGGIQPYTKADVAFMQGMISHHAQAILIAKWAPGHGANDGVQRLAERIVVAQRDEIVLMQTWLKDRKETVTAADTLGHSSEHAGHAMPGMTAATPMPGMLTTAQLAQLDSARGRAFDRLFLRFMIQHHEGALTMVKALFASQGAANDTEIYRFAADVEADQSAEIHRMTIMLNALPPGGGTSR
jgi:uncharacterized protein (DUF305 family)